MPRNEEFDWIFDFVLQFLESDKFDAAIMNFLDDHCDVFDDEEENKFIYSSIHKEFCERIENLISENLGELGITNEIFVEACTRGRSGRDINSTVFERLIAMEDFQTFKKIMVKRNTELKIEALQGVHGKISLVDRSFDFDSGEILQDEDMQDLLFQSLMEMELMHRQEELEHAELERAILMSLIIEGERLKEITSEFFEDFERIKQLDLEYADAKESSTDRDAKQTSNSSSSSSSSSGGGSKGDAPSAKDEKNSSSTAGKPSASSSTTTTSTAAGSSEPKALKPLAGERLRPLPALGAKALPPIGSSGSSASSSELSEKLVNEFDEKRKATALALKKSAQQLADNRRQEEQLRQQVDAEEVERRARHMKEQRDLLIAKKKEERERKVQQEAERRAKKAADDDEDGAVITPDAVERLQAHLVQQAADRDAKNGDDAKRSADEMAEIRRNTMRNALARRMKLDLIEAEENKKSQQQDDQFSDLDLKLQQVEQLREDNRKREYLMNKQVERQQAQIARNIRNSAATLSRDN